MIVSFWWVYPEVIIRSYCKCPCDDLADKVSSFMPNFNLSLFIHADSVDDLGVDELWCHPSQHKVLHNFAQSPYAIHPLQVYFKVPPTDLAVFGVLLECRLKLSLVRFPEITSGIFTEVWNISVKFRK